METERRKSVLVRGLPLAVLGIVFGLIFVWAYGLPSAKPAVSGAKTSNVGVYQAHSYVISATPGSKEKRSEFSPPLPGDNDELIIGMARKVGESAFGEDLSALKPTVEIIGEQHYLSFVDESNEMIFRLTKSEEGKVREFTFWRGH
jgi:hypothetical protein